MEGSDDDSTVGSPFSHIDRQSPTITEVGRSSVMSSVRKNLSKVGNDDEKIKAKNSHVASCVGHIDVILAELKNAIFG